VLDNGAVRAPETALYKDSFTPNRWRQLLNTSWPLFSAFGVAVRVSWTVAIWPLFLALLWSKHYPAVEALGWGVVWTLALFTCVYTHEMGHILAARRYGVTANRITLRALGGLAHMDTPNPHPRAEMVVAAAGPVTHIPWLALLFGSHWLAREAGATGDWVWMLRGLGFLQLYMMGFNLLPFYPLDGGRILRGFLAQRMHPNKASLMTANVGYGGAVMLGLSGLAAWIGDFDWLGLGNWGFFMLWIGIENFMACKRLTMEARWGEGPYAAGESWKGGQHADPFGESLAASEKLNRAAEKEEKKLAEQKDKERAERERLQRRVDELLDRINEVGGLENLSTAEQRELREASELLRRAPAGEAG